MCSRNPADIAIFAGFTANYTPTVCVHALGLVIWRTTRSFPHLIAEMRRIQGKRQTTEKLKEHHSKSHANDDDDDDEPRRRRTFIVKLRRSKAAFAYKHMLVSLRVPVESTLTARRVYNVHP